jgi:hypothetical protein
MIPFPTVSGKSCHPAMATSHHQAKALKNSWISNCQPRGFSLPEGSQLHDFFEYRCHLGFTYFIKTYQNRDLRFLKPTMIR